MIISTRQSLFASDPRSSLPSCCRNSLVDALKCSPTSYSSLWLSTWPESSSRRRKLVEFDEQHVLTQEYVRAMTSEQRASGPTTSAGIDIAATQPAPTGPSSSAIKRRFSRKSKATDLIQTSDAQDGPLSSANSLPPDVRKKVAGRRQDMVQQRTGDLRAVVDNHDDLLREAFHLEKFVTLVGYDPEAAKADNSTVFQEFRSQYDLMSLVSTISATSAPRKTRGRVIENAGVLASLSGMLTDEGKEKSRANPPPSVPKRGRGRGRGSFGRGGPRSDSHASLGKGKGRARPSLVETDGEEWRNSEDLDIDNFWEPSAKRRVGRPPKRRPKLEDDPYDYSPRGVKRPFEEDIPDVPTSPLIGPLQNVKRVRVKPPRIPDPEYTSPDQRPTPPRFENVSAYLNSYVAVEDEDLSLTDLGRLAQDEAILRARISELRAQGRLREPDEAPIAIPSSSDPKRQTDHRDHLIVHAALLSKRMQEETRNRQSVIRRICKGMATHHERIATADDRVRQAEDKRVRALAKFTIKEVMKKWREAINHVREVKNAIAREEQAKMGKMHLNAILEQSTQVLEAQHLDLVRGKHRSRSRSDSVATSLQESRSDTDEDDVSVSERDDDEQEGNNEEKDDGEEEEIEETTDFEEGAEEEIEDDEAEGESDEEGDAHYAMEDDAQEEAMEYLENDLRDDNSIDAEAAYSWDTGGDRNWKDHSWNTQDRLQNAKNMEDEPREGIGVGYDVVGLPTNGIHRSSSRNGTNAAPVNGTFNHLDTERPVLNGEGLTVQPNRSHVPPSPLASPQDAPSVGSSGVQKRRRPSPTSKLAIFPHPTSSSYTLRTAKYPIPSIPSLTDEHDVEFMAHPDEHRDSVDRKMEKELELEEHEGAIGDDSDQELQGLEAEADAPIQEVLKQYHYGNANGAQPHGGNDDAADGEFREEEPQDQDDEDRRLVAAMEDEDEGADDAAELDGLEADADVPIEELLQQYGYVPKDGPGDRAESHHYEADVEAAAESLSSGESSPPQPSSEDIVEPPAESAVVVGRDESEAKSSADLNGNVAEERPGNFQAEPGYEATTPRRYLHEPASPSEVEDERLPDADDDEAMAILDAASPLPSEAETNQSIGDEGRIRQPFLLRGTLRPYQHGGLEWLVSLFNNGLNGILADEMGLGKTIQTIALLAYLACEKGIWGPHLIIVPTSVILNWEMEFKRFFPGFKILTYYGNVKERKERRAGWNTEGSFNVCITSYQLVLADQHIFRRKQWRYLILDEAHNIKNFRSQRWQTLLGFNSQRRLLLTGTPLQNNLMELWSLLYFLMPTGLSEELRMGTFAGQKEFAEWFSNPMDKAIKEKEGPNLDDETLETVNKLHTLLRPYLLRRMKAEVEKQLPGKYDHIVYCRLSKRQRFLYDEFMARAATRETLATGNFLSVVNLLMQLRKISNHPDLFEVRPIVTSFAMSRSAIADYEIKELLLRRTILIQDPLSEPDLEVLGLAFTGREHLSTVISRDLRRLDPASRLPFISDLPGEPPPVDTVTIAGFTKHAEYQRRVATIARWKHVGYLNSLRCSRQPVYGSELFRLIGKVYTPVIPLEEASLDRRNALARVDRVSSMVQSYRQRMEIMSSYVDRFACATPPVVALDLPKFALPGIQPDSYPELLDPSFDTLHQASVKLQIAFPDASLLQYDCGKLQELDVLLRERKRGGHRVLIFTQMTRVLDILEIFLNLHGYRYLRLDGATKIEQRQIITERFNVDPRIFAFIASSRSGGVGINLTGADTVIFFDSDFNPAMDRQCEDRAHRIGQTRDVHIYRFITRHTIEENMLLTANHKRQLDHVVIQQGEFDWRKILVDDLQMEQALAQVEDQADTTAAQIARAEDRLDFTDFSEQVVRSGGKENEEVAPGEEQVPEQEEGGTTVDYMVTCIERDWDYFSTL